MNDIANTAKVTVPFEARDLLSGALRQMRTLIQGASDDLLEFKRRSGNMYDDLVSGSRRARSAADDLTRRIGNTSDEIRRMNQSQVDDIFRRARSGADELRRSTSRADSEIRGLSDARVRLSATDEISPVVDNITGKIGALAAAAGGIVIGGGIADSMFGGVMDYSREASRSAAFLPSDVRQESLNTVDTLYKQGLITDRVEGTRQLANAAPLVQDKTQMTDFVGAAAKIQYIRPDAGSEEVQRALSQASNSFNETYSQVADSMMYAYKEVGDRQQDLFDTFWEYSGFFKNMNVDSSQMANFLTQSVQEGAYNFDKPADFFKETFGVKALNAGDMSAYFESRGSGKDEAARQAQSFTADINSGDEQKAQGAISALLADLASQDRNTLKQSLTTLGSAAAEDNADSILKTYGVAFEKAPDMTGTTDRLVQTQQAADPMLAVRQTQAEINLELQNVGATLATASLPALQEFNTLLGQNKDEIAALGGGIASAVTGAVTFYTDHMTAINTALMGLAAVAAIKGIVNVTNGIKQLNQDLMGAAKWVGDKGGAAGGGIKTAWNWIRGKQPDPPVPPGTETPAQRSQRIRGAMGGRGVSREWRRGGSGPAGGGMGGLRTAGSMSINARIVYLSGRVAGGGAGNGGGRHGGRRGRRGGGGPAPNPNPGPRIGSRDNPYRVRRPTPPTPDPIPDVSPPRGGGRLGKLGGAIKGAGKVLKVGGVIGTVASVASGAIDMYEATKEKGLREAVSTQGGAMVGGIAGGAIGGAVGSVLGPLGTMAGAYIGNVVGEKIGKFADESGATRWVVDKAVGAFDTVKNHFAENAKTIASWMGIKKEEKPGPPPEAIVKFTVPPETEERLQEVYAEFSKNVAEGGLQEGFKSVIDQPEVKKATEVFGQMYDTMKNSMGFGKTKDGIDEIGDAAKSTGAAAEQMGVKVEQGTNEIAQGAKTAGTEVKGISGAVKTAADAASQYLLQIKNVTSQGESWGSTLMGSLIAGIRRHFPGLSALVDSIGELVSRAANNATGGSSTSPKTKEYANGGYIARPHLGLVGEAGPEMIIPLSAGRRSRGQALWEQAGSILGVRAYADGGLVGRSSLLSRPSMPIAQAFSGSAAGNTSVSIGNITIDFGQLAQGITNFSEFAAMLTSPQGRALIRKVLGEEMLRALEIGG